MTWPAHRRKTPIQLFIACCFLSFSFFAKSQIITTIAGNGTGGFSGDGGLSVNALVKSPLGLCLDPAGNLYFTDYGNQRIRRIDAATGIISTVAGNGTTGFSGDGGPALNAQLNGPFRLCLDNFNNLYFSDYNNLRVRKVNLTTGIITTVAGNGTENYINGGLAVNSGMLPAGVAIDASGNLFLSQHIGPLVSFTTNIISKVNLTTGIVTTIAGTGAFGYGGDGGPALNAQLLHPNGLMFDAAGNLIFDDQNNNRVRKINMTTGIITTIAGDGGANYNKPDGTAAVSYSFKNLTDIFVDGNGNILLADESNLKIQEMNAVTGIISTHAGTGYLGFGADCVDPKSVTLGDCAGVVKDLAGNIYFTDLTFHRIRKIIKGSNLIPKVQIASDKNNVCVGSEINFSASVQDSGPNPVYQWTVNGVNAGTNSPVFTSSSLANNAVVVCKLTSGSASICPSVNTGISNAVTVVIKPVTKPLVTVAASASIICTGTPVTFTAITSDVGTNAEFQWSINGLPAGSNQNSLTSSSLFNNDVVSCLLIADPNQSCLLNDSAVSNTIVMQVSAAVAPAVTINSSGNTICPNDGVKFTASGQNAGSNPSYQWMINGIQTGTNSAVYENTNFQNGDNIYCVLTANNTGCPSNSPVVSNTETILVKPAPVINLGCSDTTISPMQQVQLKASFSGDLASFSWSPASKLVNATDAETLTLPLTETTLFQINAIAVNGCAAIKQVKVYIFYDKLYIPSAFTPNGDGLNDMFRIPDKVAITLKEFSIFDRWGKKIFTTKDRMKGWDGMNNGKPVNTGVYVYMISGLTPDGNVLSKGTVTLIR